MNPLSWIKSNRELGELLYACFLLSGQSKPKKEFIQKAKKKPHNTIPIQAPNDDKILSKLNLNKNPFSSKGMGSCASLTLLIWNLN